MKTIELMISGQKAQFTTKSVTFDGKEYFYSNMTHLDHSPVVRTYRFEYDGEAKLLTYEKKDAKIMAAIFSQVYKMIEQKKAKVSEAAKTPEAVKPAKAAPAVESEAPAKPEVQEDAKAEVPAEKAETAEVSDGMDEMIQATIAINAEREKKEAEKAAKKARKKAIKEAKKNGTPLPEEEKKEDGNEEGSEEKQPVDPEKKAKLKKSLKVFAIVVAVVIAASLIYYFVFGTNNSPSDNNPAITESQQYEDIDQLIEDLQ